MGKIKELTNAYDTVKDKLVDIATYVTDGYTVTIRPNKDDVKVTIHKERQV